MRATTKIKLTPLDDAIRRRDLVKKIIAPTAESARAERASDARSSALVVHAPHQVCANHLRARTQAAEAPRSSNPSLSGEPGKHTFCDVTRALRRAMPTPPGAPASRCLAPRRASIRSNTNPNIRRSERSRRLPKSLRNQQSSRSEQVRCSAVSALRRARADTMCARITCELARTADGASRRAITLSAASPESTRSATQPARTSPGHADSIG